MKLLVDINLSPRWIDLLTQSQFEAVHWSSVGSPHALDQIGSTVAVEQQRTSSWHTSRSVPLGVRDQSGFR